MKQTSRSIQHHDLYRKYHGQDSKIKDLLGEYGIKTVLKAMEQPYPEKIFLYERAFKRCRDGEFDLVNNKYFLEFFDNFVAQHPKLKEQLEYNR